MYLNTFQQKICCQVKCFSYC